MLTAMGMRIAENGCFYIFTVFVLAYGEETLNLAKNTMLTGVMIAAAHRPVDGPALRRAVGPLRAPEALHGGRACSRSLFAFPFFALLDTKEPVLIWLAIVLGVNVGHDLMYGPQAAYFSELFATRMRYTGASVGYQLASVFAGGFAPLIAVALLAAGDDEPYARRALHGGAWALITVVATYFARETFRADLGESRDARARPGASCASRPRTASGRRPGSR